MGLLVWVPLIQSIVGWLKHTVDWWDIKLLARKKISHFKYIPTHKNKNDVKLSFAIKLKQNKTLREVV